MTQYIKTVLEVDASKAVAGFKQGEKAVNGYATAVKTVGSDADRAASQGGAGLARLTGSIRDNRAAWDDLSSKAMIGGAALAGGLGLAAKAAIDWESAWAGVAKTVDGTPKQMADLEEGLRGLAKELPATHEEIAGVAEAAGQLGVARKDILGFTETAIALGESTNLSAEEAATSLAKFSNIMGTTAREGVEGYEKLGSTLVALGNDGASTEQDIMQMALRLAGAGKQIGATEADILAMSNALSSVGIEAELGGGAMSRAMLEMNSAVIGGGDELEKFAEISGMSAQEFATKWRSDPIAATNDFVGGLGRVGASGGDASAALDSVGLAGTQNAQVLLRAAGASDLMSDSLKLGASAWQANAALQEEAAKRYETDASRIQVSMNRAKDATISFGASIAPFLATGTEKLAGLADAIGGLPGPVRDTVAALAGITAVGLLGGGLTVKTIGLVQDFGDAIGSISGKADKTSGSVDRANRSMGGVAKWGGYALGVTAVVTALNAIEDAATPTPSSVEEVTSAILDLDRAGSKVVGLKNVNEIFQDLDKQSGIQRALIDTSVGVDSLADAYRRLNDPTALESTTNVIDGMQGWIGMTGDVEKLEGVFKTFGESLANMPADEAAAQFDLMVQSIGGGEKTAKRLLELMPAYRDQLKGSENDARMAGDGASKMGGDLEGMAGEAMSAEDEVEGLSDAISGLGDTLLAQSDASIGYQQSLDDLSKSIGENGRTLDLNYEAGRNNQSALNDLAQSTKDYAAATLESTGSMSQAEGVLSRGRTQWEKYAAAAGMPKSQIKATADELFKLPADVKTQFKTEGLDTAKMGAVQLGAALGGVSTSAGSAKGNVLALDSTIESLDGKTVTVEEAGANASQIRVRELDGALIGLPAGKKVQVQEIGSTKAGEMVVQFKDKVFSIPASKTAQIRQSGAENARAKVLGFNDSIRLLSGKTVKVGEDGAQNATGKIRTMDGAIFGLKGKTVKVEEIGATASGDRVVSFRDKIYSVNSKSVDVRANVHGLWDVGALIGQINGVQNKTVTITAVTKKMNSWFADGGMIEGGVQSFADGGHWDGSFRSARPQIRPAGGRGVNWAEDGAGPWEAFISGHPGKKARSLAILDQVASRLGRATMPIESFASGGVYGNWRKWMLEAQRMSNRGRYRFEDGDRMIRIFEDGTAQWRGYSAPTSEARQVIARLNAAQDRYEDALNARDRQRSATKAAPKRYTGQHSAEYERKQAEWERIRQQRATKTRYTGEHSDYYDRKQAEWKRIREEQAAKKAEPKSWAGHAFQRMPVTPHAGRTYVAPQFRTVASGGASTVTQVDSRAIGAAVASAVGSEIRQLRVVTTINGRDFQGTLQKTARDRKGR